MISKEVTTISDGKTIVAAYFDKNYAMCDITPRMNSTLEVLNTYRGRPYSLIRQELLLILRQIAHSDEMKEYEDVMNRYNKPTMEEIE